MPNTTKPTHSKAVASVILFGLDKEKKLRAGWFTKDHLELAIKAAAANGFSVLKIEGDAHRKLVAKLKVGNVHAAGNGLIPVVGRQIFAQIEAAAGANVSNTKTKAGGALGDIAYRGIPRTWDEIDVGHLVIAQESLKDGWYEAIVIARDGDRLKVRWRDFPKYAPFERPLTAIALPCPTPQAEAQAA